MNCGKNIFSDLQACVANGHDKKIVKNIYNYYYFDFFIRIIVTFLIKKTFVSMVLKKIFQRCKVNEMSYL